MTADDAGTADDLSDEPDPIARLREHNPDPNDLLASIRLIRAAVVEDAERRDGVTEYLSDRALRDDAQVERLAASVERLTTARTGPTGRAHLWDDLDALHQREAWGRLIAWMNTALVRQAPALAETIARSACWQEHGDVIDLLDALRSAWSHAYRPSQEHITSEDREREREAAEAATTAKDKAAKPRQGDDDASLLPIDYLTRWLAPAAVSITGALSSCQPHTPPTTLAPFTAPEIKE